MDRSLGNRHISTFCLFQGTRLIVILDDYKSITMLLWCLLVTLSAQLLVLESYCSGIMMLANRTSTIPPQHNTPSVGVDDSLGEDTDIQSDTSSAGVADLIAEETNAQRDKPDVGASAPRTGETDVLSDTPSAIVGDLRADEAKVQPDTSNTVASQLEQGTNVQNGTSKTGVGSPRTGGTNVHNGTSNARVDVGEPKANKTSVQTTPANMDSSMDDANMDHDNDKDGKEIVDKHDALNNTDIRSELPGLLAMFCPGADVCLDDNSEVLSEDVNTSSCCRACSCSDDCQLTRNCCFPSSNIETDENKHSSCYSTLYPSRRNGEDMGYKSYMMVDSEILHSSMTANSTCGNTDVAPWGSLYPVYSKSHKKIYKNSVCAAAYGVEDPDLWTVYVACLRQMSITNNYVLSNALEGTRCDVWFEFPGQNSVIDRHMCFINLISSCRATFSLSTTLSHDQLIAACESDLFSPYRSAQNLKTYRNVFCSVCNGMYGDCEGDVEAVRGTRPYSALLDQSVFAAFNKPSPSTAVQQACIFKDDHVVENTCRVVLCPVGQTYTSDGKCEFIFKTWYKPRFVVSLQLTSSALINTTGLTRSSFTPPTGLRNWLVSKIYHFTSETNQLTLTNKILIELHKRFDSISPKVITNKINKLKNKEWSVETMNGSFSLKADFMDARDRYHVHDFLWETKATINDTRILNTIYRDESINTYTSFVTFSRMTFCEQVQLTIGEFSTINIMSNNILYNNITDKMLLLDEYHFPYMANGTFVRVCIEDSGLRQVSNRGHSPSLTSILFLYTFLSLYLKSI